jgi:cystathionine beta-lyase
MPPPADDPPARAPLDVATAFHRITLEQLRRRRGLKWRHYGPDVIPAWVADMDFPVAPPIERALRAAITRGDLGYPTLDDDGLGERFAAWSRVRYGHEPDPTRTHLVADVMVGVRAAIEACSAPGDGVVITPPVYPPFWHAIRDAGRRVVTVPLLHERGRWAYDQRALYAQLDVPEPPRMVLLAHPHNPTGLADTTSLAPFVRLAAEAGCSIVSDEIHADLTLPPRTHTPVAALHPQVAAATVTLTSASKAFNTAGLRCALVVAGSDDLHRRLMALPEHWRHGVGILGIAATHAAWSPEGAEWLGALHTVLRANIARVDRAVASGELAPLRWDPPEATYLGWLDARDAALGSHPARRMRHDAGVALSEGDAFGPQGEGWVRLNLATPPAILEVIVRRIAAVLPRTPTTGG